MDPVIPAKPVREKRRILTWRRILFGLLAVSPAGWLAGVGVFAGWQLARPPENASADRPRHEATDPARFGLRVEAGHTQSGIPYWLVTPDPVAGPGERGAKLRAELTALGETLPAYGFTDATIVLLHGRGGSKNSLLGIAERFAATGFRCLIPDLPGHGELKDRGCGYGAGAGEAALPREVADDALGRFGLPGGQPRLLWGMSMGGSFAVHAAAAAPNDWAGLLVVAGFANLDEVVAPRLRTLSGPGYRIARRATGWIARQNGGVEPWRVRPDRAAPRAILPAMVIHGTADTLVPIAQGQRLFQSLGGRDKAWIEVAGADHRNLFTTPQPVYAPMTRWARQRARQWVPPDVR